MSNKTKKLYIIRAKGSNLYKIGVSNDPEKRLKQLQTANPVQLILVAVYYESGDERGDFNAADFEQEIHGTLAYCKVSGEWFEMGRDELDHFFSCLQVYVYGLPSRKMTGGKSGL